jgi:NADPH:quinone reductase-like Zn-dependent oxidoreductase
VKAAIVVEAGKTPIYGDFKEPVPGEGEVLITVRAAALSPLVRSQASGAHYSSSGQFPFVVGADGVGRLEDGRRVYFVLPRAPFGSMAEKSVVKSALCAPIPDDLDDESAAAIASSGFGSWTPLKERARLLAGETVLVNGATGATGRVAVQVAKHLGARKVVATGRDTEALKSTEALGADITIPLGDAGDAFENALKAQFSADGIDVVLDYLWGRSAERILIAAAKGGRGSKAMRFVSVGTTSGPTITLPSSLLRSTAITLLGSGIGSIPVDIVGKSIGEFLGVARSAGFEIATTIYPLSDVERVWPAPVDRSRIVFQVK